MEFSNVNLIRFKGQNGCGPKINVIHDFEYRGSEYIYARQLNNAENMPFGRGFFMEVVKGLRGQRGCIRVRDIDTVAALRQFMGKTTGLDDYLGADKPETLYMYCPGENGSEEPSVREILFTHLRRKPDGTIGCEKIRETEKKYSGLMKLSDGAASWGTDEQDAVRTDILCELRHDGRDYLYISDVSQDEEDRYFALIRNDGNKRVVCERIENEEIAECLWDEIVSLAETRESEMNALKCPAKLLYS